MRLAHSISPYNGISNHLAFLSPPKIKAIRIVENPFTDIVPRITAAERKAQHEARIEIAKESERREQRRKAKKWVDCQSLRKIRKGWADLST